MCFPPRNTMSCATLGATSHGTATASAFATGLDRGYRRGATASVGSSSGRKFRGETWRATTPTRGSRNRVSTLNPTASLPEIRLLKFDPKRCSVFFLDTQRTTPEPNRERRYTLTHNDVTRHLTMSVAPDFNGGQTAVWITKVLRDEVLAEWREDGLHVHCFVRVDGHWWLDWAKGLRSLVFRQKLPLVLDTLRFAETELLAARPKLLDAPVFVHFHEEKNEALSGGEGYREWDTMAGGTREHWGPLRDAGKRLGDDQRVALAVSKNEINSNSKAFSRARDLWSGGSGKEIEASTTSKQSVSMDSVGSFIEGALAGGGDGADREPSPIAASRSR